MNLLKLMREKWRAALGIKTEAQTIYAASVLPEPVEGLAKYPPKDFLAERGVYAYRSDFMLADASSLVACIRSHFPTVSNDVFQEGPHQSGNGESIHFAVRPEFRGASVEMLTNSVNLLRAIDALHVTPPPPWKVFPHLDPETMGSMQGDVDYWWWLYWGPFWNNASPPEREQYLQVHKASQSWIEYFEFRDFLATSHLLEPSSQAKT
jgi:hypothetical protein